MSKKAKKMEIENEIVTTTEIVEPIMKVEVIESNLKSGFVAITHVSKGGRIVVNANQIGSIYKEDIWQVIETAKK